MFFMIERYVIRAGARYVRRCFSRNVDALTNEQQEFVLQADTDFKFVRREGISGKKSLKISILGAPNVGKSTIINQLSKRSVCPTSCKVHTTQTKARAIYNDNDTQLIFMDTPGMVSQKECNRFKLANSFRSDPKECLKASDIVGIVQDVHNIYERDKINLNILNLLTEDIKNNIPLILIFNKVDRLKNKTLLLHLANILTKSKNSLNFSDVFMISALTGDGIDDLRTYLLDSAQSQDWQYKEHEYSDRTCEDIIEQTVRAKLMDDLPNEIPYKMQLKLEHFNPGPDNSIAALVSVTCPNKRIIRLLLRNNGKRIRNIAIVIEMELRNAFRMPVRLKINVQ